ncbi:capsular polysaccharide biosynthesis protein [Lonepinella sp. MS14436]|uniref:capsular polysaccharide biosynthesis protein n=1 Tax=Lonepinella sp. MS14436 TaxID=3003619 RepID=UPI0036DC18EE
MFFSTIGLYKQKKRLALLLKGNEFLNSCLFWGRKHLIREKIAEKLGIHSLYLEDGFLRSIGLGVQGYPSYSFVVDDLGIYYDTTRPSRLQQLILDAEFSQVDLDNAKQAMLLICQYQLSKYNHVPNFEFNAKHKNKPIILVIDQTVGDMAVKYGQADENNFQQMLQAAIDENPDCEIWIKTHPDVICGKKKGYLTGLNNPKINLLSNDVNPISLLKSVEKVYCVTSQMGFEALMLGKKVITFGVPWFAGWGLTDDRHHNLGKKTPKNDRTLLVLFAAAYLKYSCYINPNTGEQGTIFDVIDSLVYEKYWAKQLKGDFYCVDVSLWKKSVIKPFFNFPSCRLYFISSLNKLKQMVLPEQSKLLVWGNGKKELLDYAEEHNIPIIRMEDGFIRSVGLGSNLTAPLSLVVDDLGIYFNAQNPSRLEWILQNQYFEQSDLETAKEIKHRLIQQRIGKYNVGQGVVNLPKTPKTKILVVGQVEDDASIMFGSPQIKTNKALLQKVRTENPNAYIIYKPHPDVVSGNRMGDVAADVLAKYADQIVIDANILDCIEQIDELHTMTSLAGFEALLRNKKVVCYGLPFYANWGLTEDKISLSRRTRKLTLNELIVGVLIYYPIYLNPNTGRITKVQYVIELLNQQKKEKSLSFNRSWLVKQLEKLKQLYYAVK